MRRLILALLGLLLLLVLLAGGLQGSRALRAAVAEHPEAPTVIAGRDLSADNATAPVPVGYASLRCSWEGDGKPGLLRASSLAGEGTVDGSYVAGLHRVDLAPGEWQLAWVGRGADVPLGKMRLEAGDVRSCALGGQASLAGSIRSPEGRPVEGASVIGCGYQVKSGADGRWSLSFPNRACRLHAEWMDGALRRVSAGVVYEPFAPVPGFDFVVDDRPIGGVGLALGVDEDGVFIDDVLPNTPGDAAGLLPGDRITSVDGGAIAGKSLDEVVAVITGSPDTPVTLGVQREDGPATLTLTRAPIGQEPDTGP